MKKPKKQDQGKSKPISREQMQMDNQKLMEHIAKMNFNSIEEISEYLEKNISGKRIDEAIPKKRGPKSNIEKSDDLIYKAYEVENEIEKIKLINDALKLNPENVRAIVLKADCSSDINKALDLYKKAMEISEKELGKEFFKENKGYFWGMHNTRPYMSAKLKYAQALQIIKGKSEEAIRQLEELLELNPNDNQGVRYLLSLMYLKKKRYNDFLDLYNEYDESSTHWNYNYLLYLLITDGTKSKVKKAFKSALEANPHVIGILIGEHEFQDTAQVTHYSPGDINEANYYLGDAFEFFSNNKIVIKKLVKLIEDHFGQK